MAQLFVKRGYRVYGLGRRPYHSLDHLPIPNHQYCQLDLNEAGIGQKVLHFFQEAGINKVDFVVHNAGMGYYGRLAEQTPTNITSQLYVNLLAPIQISHALMPLLIEAHGHLSFVSSLATNLPAPDYAIYTATKAALEGFARSLRVEMAGRVTVQILQPGATRTGMHQKLNISIEQMNWQAFPSAAVTAQRMVRAIEGKRPLQVIGQTNKLVRLTGRALPRLFDQLMKRTTSTQKGSPAHQRSCLITGAADGIGRALAMQFGKAGYTLIGVDVDEVKAKETAKILQDNGTAVRFIIADLTTQQGIEKVVEALATQPPLDLLINNAGINAVGPFEKLPLPIQTKVVQLNFWAPLTLTAVLLQKKYFQPQAGFIFLSSLATFASYPGAAVYAATKVGIANFARQLWAELGGHHPVLTVYPGPTRTAHAARYSPDSGRESNRMPPEVVASQVVEAFEHGRRHLVPGFANKLVAFAGNILPSLVEAGMRKVIYDQLQGNVIE